VNNTTIRIKIPARLFESIKHKEALQESVKMVKSLKKKAKKDIK